MERKILFAGAASIFAATLAATAALGADGTVGNEVVGAKNQTLTRSGSGTAASPYRLSLNLKNANAWTGTQTFKAATNFPGGVWDAAGRVGIGTSAPSAALEVVEAFDASSGAFVTGLRAGTFGSLQAGAYNQVRGITDYTAIDETSAGEIWGPIGLDVQTNNMGSGHVKVISGISSISGSRGLGNVDYLEGLALQVYADGRGLATPGAVGTAYGIWMNNYANGAAIGNLYGVYLDNPWTADGGAIANSYALYIKSQTGASGANYAIYSEGGTNHFGGQVGIGTTSPSYQLDVVGDIGYSGGLFNTSDLRLKENVEPIPDALGKVLAVNGIFFSFRDRTPSRREVGLIAQEVEAVLPEVVAADAQGYKSVDYAKLTALLVEAVKAQQTQIEELRNRVAALEKH